MNKDQDKIKEKIAKLMRKAESAKELGSIEEAATFMMMANKMLMKYNLERTDIELEDTSNKLTHEYLNLNDEHKWNKSSGDWMIHIYNMVASMNLCSVIYMKKKNFKRDENNQIRFNSKGQPVEHIWMRLTLIGNPMNKEMTRYMTTSMINQLIYLSKDAWKEYQKLGGTDKVNAWKRAYFSGATRTLYKIFADFKEGQYKEVGTSLTSLIRTNDIELRNYQDEVIGGTKRGKNGRYGSNDGRNQGKRDGHKVTVNKGLSSSSMVNSVRMLG